MPEEITTYDFGESLKEPITLTYTTEQNGKTKTVQGSFYIWTYRQNQSFETIDVNDTIKEADQKFHKLEDD